MSQEIRMVITIRDGTMRLAIQQSSCDPLFFPPVPASTEDEISAVLGPVIGESLRQAKGKWQTDPRYPPAAIPEPAPATPPVPVRPTASSPAKTPNQPQIAMF